MFYNIDTLTARQVNDYLVMYAQIIPTREQCEQIVKMIKAEKPEAVTGSMFKELYKQIVN